MKSLVSGVMLAQNVENIEAATSLVGANLRGNDLANVVTGSRGNDYLSGRGGNDTLVGKGGADTLVGGTGDDVYIMDPAASAGSLREEASGGIDTLISSAGVTKLGANFERLILTLSTGATGISSVGDTDLVGDQVRVMLIQLATVPLSALHSSSPCGA